MTPITNAHTHLELGWLADHCPGVIGRPFLEWILGLVERRAALADAWEQPYEASIEAGIEELVEAGTTAVGDISVSGKSIGPLLNSGLHGVVYVEVLGPWSAQADERLARARAIVEQWRPQERNGMRIGITIHSGYTTHRVLWEKALDYTRKEALPLCIHVAESPAEYQYLTQGSGPIAEHNAAIGADITSPLTTPIRYLDDLGALELQPLLVHAVHVDEDDIRRIQASGSRVVHCPRSNLRLRCGRMPLERYLASGVPVYLGTDSRASCPSLNIWHELDVAVALHYGKVEFEEVEGMVRREL